MMDSTLDLPLRPTTGDSSWFTQARFGLFIHWGLYALAARHEWVKQHERMTDEQYQRYFDHFDPDLYDPEAWADAAWSAGMRYMVVTTKHHEGFCLWDSDLTDYKATLTPCGRDLLAPLVDAFRARGMKIGFYHSLIDWHHPDFLIDDLHVLRDHPDRDSLNRDRRRQKYAEYLHGQVRELLTRFGKIDILWFDFSYPGEPGQKNARGEPWQGKGREDWKSAELVRLVRELQPGVLLDDRLDLSSQAEAWDFTTPEQYQPDGWPTFEGQRAVWEACQTFSGSWGYHRDEASWKSVGQLIRMLIDTVSKGGNLLLNVGPTGRGEFDARALHRLAGIGEWMKRHSRSVHGCTAAPRGLEPPSDCRLTYNPVTSRLYLHVFAWPFQRLLVRGLADRLEYAQLLNDASEVRFDAGDDGSVTLHLPVAEPDPAATVIELFLRSKG